MFLKGLYGMKRKQGNDRSTSKFVGVRLPNYLHEILFNTSEKSGVSASKILIDALAEKLQEKEVTKR